MELVIGFEASERPGGRYIRKHLYDEQRAPIYHPQQNEHPDENDILGRSLTGVRVEYHALPNSADLGPLIPLPLQYHEFLQGNGLPGVEYASVPNSNAIDPLFGGELCWVLSPPIAIGSLNHETRNHVVALDEIVARAATRRTASSAQPSPRRGAVPDWTLGVGGVGGTVAAVANPPAPSEPEKIDTSLVSVVRVGRSVYRLRKPAGWTFRPGAEAAPGRFEVKGFEKLVVGRGKSSDLARTNWENRLHVKFQELYPLLADEMTGKQRRAWARLSDLVDVEAYRKSDSVVGREVGKVVKTWTDRKLVEWRNGTQEVIRFVRAIGEFACVADGEWMEALVARHPDSYKIRRIIWLKPYTPWLGSLDDETKAKIERIPTVASLPKTTWD
jgi:hypothetical protein